MSSINQVFQRLRARGERALMPYICAGDPDLSTTEEILFALQAGGADLVELGLPFSDPLADGPVIQAAGQRALAAGTTVQGVLDTLARARRRGFTLPVCIMTYYNIIYSRGPATFARAAAAAGADGLIVPDLPFDEAEELRAGAQGAGLDLILFLAPTSTPDRVVAAARLGSGFLYLVSLTGVTGARERLSSSVAPLVAAARAATDLPLAVGFGIAAPEQAAEAAAAGADGVIVGSAMVRLVAEGHDRPRLLSRFREFTAALKAPLLARRQGHDRGTALL